MCGGGGDCAAWAGEGGPGRGGHSDWQRGQARGHRREDGRRQDQGHPRGARRGRQDLRIQMTD